MLIERFTLNDMGTNTYVVGEPGSAVMIIDPGAEDITPVVEFVGQQGLTVKYIINTHCHFDHVLGNEASRTQFQAPLLLHRAEVPILRDVPQRMLTWFGQRVKTREPDEYLQEGDMVSVGSLRFRVLETPGHSPGSVCLYEEAEGVLFSGDTLFAGTVGRTDLPLSSGRMLMESLKAKLWPLPDTTRIYPGHEEDSTIGEERMHNPYFRF